MYSETELLDWIHRLADDDGPPKAREIADHPEAPSPDLYRDRWGSWHEAVLEAGYYTKPYRYHEEQLLRWINRLADGDEPPTEKEVNAHPQAPHADTYRRHLGSFTEAVRQAGYTPSTHVDYSKEELVDWIDRLADGDTPPTREQMRMHDESPPKHAFVSVFGGWGAAVTSAGYTPRRGGPSKYSLGSGEILKQLRDAATNGRVTKPEIKESDACQLSATTYRRRFGSVGVAALVAGVKLGRVSSDAMIRAVRWIATRLSEPDGWTALDSLPSVERTPDQLILYGAGYDPETGAPLSDHILLEALADTVETLPADADSEAVAEECLVHPTVYDERFGDVDDAGSGRGFRSALQHVVPIH